MLSANTTVSNLVDPERLKKEINKKYIDEIGEDFVGVAHLLNGSDVYCRECSLENVVLRVGRISMVHGRPAVIVNHGGINPIRTT